ncbi:hypothetical protein JW948_16985 [bacterium]|nr:hypothetical protein [bacterium]
MRKISLILIPVLFQTALFSQDVIRGSYSYTYGDSESLIEARDTCKDLAVRDAIESYYLFVESSTEVENAMLKSDIINTLSAGYLKNLTVVEQNETGRTISTTVEATVNPEEVQAVVQKIAMSPKKEESGQTGSGPGADAPDTEQETLESLLQKYDSKMNASESDWDAKDYYRAYNQVQDLQKRLENHTLRDATVFQKKLYLCVHKRTVLIKHCIQLDMARDNNRRMAARSEVKQVAQDAIQLKDAMNKLEAVPTSSVKEEALSRFWIKKCQNTLDFVKKKAAAGRNRN